MNYCSDRNIESEKKWVSQSSRQRKKLYPNYFQIDDKTLQDFAIFAAKYGKQISFFNDNNRPDGDWSVFYRNDATISLFFLQSLETDKWLTRTSALLLQYDKAKSAEKKISVLKSLVELSSTIFLEIEQSISNLGEYGDFQTVLIKYITSKYSRFFTVASMASKVLKDRFDWNNPIVRNFDLSFNYYWKRAEQNILSADDQDWLDTAVRLLSRGLPRVIQHSESLKNEVNAFVSKEVLQSGNIKPHIALFIAFYDLYKNAQEKLNTITERHLHFYFNDILKLKPRSGTSDSVYALIYLTKGADTVQLPKGTRFNYQSNTKKESEDFILEETVEVHEGSIRNVIGINVSDQPWAGSFMKESQITTSVFDLKENSVLNLGFEITSEFLTLEEGERRIKLEFSFSRIEMLGFKQYISDSHFPFDINRVNELITHTWSLNYTHSNGWSEIEHASSNVYFHGGAQNEPLKLCFDFLIRKHELPCIPIADDIASNAASVRFTLTQKGIGLYSLFRDIKFSTAVLNISVIGVKNLILSNDYGPLPSDKPMEPFGPQPKVGANIYIGHKNLFLKPLTELNLNLEWNNLPLDSSGFKGHYKHYEGIQGNSSFKAKVAFLKDKNWIPSENKQVIDLFTGVSSPSNRDNSPISIIRRINELDITTLGLNNEARIAGPLTELNSTTTDGFIKLEFCYPFVGFGHEQYPELVKKSVYKSVKNKAEPETIFEPYTPSLKSLSVEYKTTMEIDTWGERIKFKRISPFGFESVTGSEPCSLLPFVPDDGSFLIGIEPLLSNKEISVLFKIGNKSAPAVLKGSPTFRISFLENCGWQELANEKITFDSTRKLQNTGVIKLKLPKIDAVNNPIDGKNIWIRFDLLEGDIGQYLENLHLNPVQIKRENTPDYDSQFLGKWAITSMKNEMVQIARIEQPYESFNGKLPEVPADFQLRVSERIRHRSRAVSNQDIEQLLLSEFDTIQSLKCLNHMDSNFNFKPGHIVIAVVPFDSEKTNAMERYFPNEVLLNMQEFLQTRVLTGIHLSVVNPVYERIRLKFSVKFKAGFNEQLAFKKLSQRITAFLNPWTSEKIASYGGLIPASIILNELNLEESVEYISNFSAFHLINNEIVNLNNASNKDLVITARSPVSVLIPDQKHKLLLFNDNMATDKPGINDMMIGSDFLIKSPPGNNKIGLGFEALEKSFRLSPASTVLSGEKHIFTLYVK